MNKPIIALVCILTAIFILMLPLREQSFRDDFAYGWSVKHMIETGELKISEWSSSADIFPTWWGTGWSQIFGFSFRTLHAANFFLFSVGIITYFLLLKQLSIPPGKSLFFTLFLLSNPWMINFAMSYMSDIPAISLSIIAFYFFRKGIRRNSSGMFLIGGGVAGLSFLTRQIALSFTFGFLAMIIYHLKQREKQKVIAETTGLIVFLLIILGYFYWLGKDNNKTLGQYYFIDKLTFQNIYQPLVSFFRGSLYKTLSVLLLIFNRVIFYLSQMIVFTLPIWLIYLKYIIRLIFKKNNLRNYISSLLIITGIYAADVWLNRKGYTAGYPIAAFEIVPIWPWFWPRLWKYLLGIGIIFWATIPVLLKSRHRKLITPTSLLLGFTFVGYLWFSTTNVWVWPQYGIQLFPFALLFLAWLTPKMKLHRLLTIIIVTIILVYSTALAKFRYQLGGDVWKTCENLVKTGYKPSEIECNGQYSHRYWHDFEPVMAERVTAVGREEFIRTNDGSWSDYKGIPYKVRVNVIYHDALLNRQPKIVISKLD